jgi:3-oxoacyl-(acyl-carrier-protein) synthase
MERRVVVTGMAIWSPYGRGLEVFWAGLTGAESARKPSRRIDTERPGYRTDQAAAIIEIGREDEDNADAEASRILETVCQDLLADAGLASGTDSVQPWEVGVYLGSSQSVTRPLRTFMHARRAERTPELGNSPLSAASVAGDVAQSVGAQGPALVVSTACASATSAIGIATDGIQQGRIRRAIVGGVGYFTEITFSGFNILRLTGRDGCKPFDAERDGMMLGDGFALAILEDEELALARDARIRAKIVGHASGNEAFHPTSPSPDGDAAFRVMWDALGRSEALLNQLDYINAHGTGTAVNDAAEISAIRRLLTLRTEPGRVAVSSTKGHHGHALGAAGGVELVATILALENAIVPANSGLQTSDPAFAGVHLVQGAAQAHPIRVALSNSFAFGGNVSVVAIAAPEAPLP